MKIGAFGEGAGFSSEALALMLKGVRRGDGEGVADDPPPADWMPESTWRMVLALSNLNG